MSQDECEGKYGAIFVTLRHKRIRLIYGILSFNLLKSCLMN